MTVCNAHGSPARKMKSRNARTQRAAELARLAGKKIQAGHWHSGGGQGTQVRIEAMNEAEWLACSYPPSMLESLRGKARERKLRLYACACCRLIWHLLIDERSRVAVQVAELFADGLLSAEEARAAFCGACDALRTVRRPQDRWPESTLRLRRSPDPQVLFRAAFKAAAAAGNGAGDTQTHIRGEEASLVNGFTRSELLRDIFGNPFRPVTIDPAWLTWNNSTVSKFAQFIYDDRAFDRLPLLADALMDAGCTNEDILAHCRSAGEHVRGCWVLDLLLGKA
jgi:hypothetical protein